MSENLRYGESEIRNFDVQKDLEIWENKHERDYTIKITLPEFCCLCPRSGDPDFATQQLLKQMGGRNLPPIKPILEINADHEIIKKLQADKLMLPQVTEIIYDLARLSEGQELENPSEFIKNVNELIAKAL